MSLGITPLYFASGDGWVWFWIVIGALWVVSKISGDSNDSSSGSGRSSTPPPRPRSPSSGGSSRPRPPSGFMGEFEIRAIEVMRGKDKDLRAIAIEARGLMPVGYTTQINFFTMGTDQTEGNGDPLLCLIESFQWPDNILFRSFLSGGTLSPNQGYGDWVEVGVAPTDTLVAPRSGTRNLQFTVMVTRGGAADSTLKSLDPICVAQTNIRVKLNGVGYKEKGEKRLEAILQSLKLGMAVAYADGSLAQSEGQALKKWAAKQLEQIDEDEREAAKAAINTIIRESGAQAKAGSLNFEQVARSLKANRITGVQLQALELCVQVMSADGVTSQKELSVIRRLGELLGVSHDDIRKLLDRNPPISRKVGATGDLTDEELVGLNMSLSKPEKQKELRRLFAMYNGRQATEKDPAKRAHNQRMIEAIARLRQKYA